MATKIRPETPADASAVRAIHLAAFPTALEADLVDGLRGRLKPWLGHVAEKDGTVVGHLLFSPVTLEPAPERPLKVYGLGPMAVHPSAQGSGIGSTLVDVAVAELSRAGADAVVVLGHPEWYPRFGFAPAAHFGLTLAMDVPAEAFLALEFTTGCLPRDGASVHYDSAFS